MIYMNENSIGKNMENVCVSESAVIASKINSENILLEQRVKMQHNEMIMGGDSNVVKGNVKVNNNEIVSANILSDTVEDSMKEKRILKKLNVMDYVNNYKNAFFREVEELNLNAGVLVDNWNVVKKHDGLSRKLRKKLGIIMARERVKRKKKCKMEMMIDEMVNDDCDVVMGNVKVNNNEIVSANILSDTVEDSMKEKRILKKLNVMDYVNNYKNAFFREVEELNLNAGVLVDNWNVVKKHDGLSRKLRKKLG
eukprot:1003112_1